MRPFSDNGSSPLELVTLTVLLVLPLGLAIGIYQQLSNELAAESIARHALRMAMLQNPESPSESIAAAVALFASDWDVPAPSYRYWCSSGCTLVTLEVSIDAAKAIQTMGLPRT